MILFLRFKLVLFFIVFFQLFNVAVVHAQDAVAVSKMIPGTIDSIETGAPFQYQITIRCDNTGTEPCTNFTFRDVLPLGMEFSESTATQAFFIGGGFGSNDPPVVVNFDAGEDPTFATPAMIELDFGDVAPGSSTVINLNVRFAPIGNYPDGLILTNTATISSDNDVDLTNNSVTSAPIESEATSSWFVDKRISSIGALDALTTYDILLRGSPSGNYWTVNAVGELALYDAIVFDLLETGLTCADVDVATTTGLAAGDHALCLAPGASGTFLSGTTVTNPSTTDYALAWDYDALYNIAEPFTAVGSQCDGCSYPATYANQVQGAGPLKVGITYPSSTFTSGQTVVNTARLYGSFADDLGGNTITPIAFLHQANRGHIVEAAVGAATFTKSMSADVRDSTFVGATTIVSLDLENTGNVDLTDLIFSDFLPAEIGNVQQIQIRVVSPTDAVATIQYSNGTSEVVMFTTDKLIEGTNFNIPLGAQIASIEIALGVPLAPGGRALLQFTAEILPTRFDDDNHTAVNDNPSQNPDNDSGTQLAGSDVALGDEVTNCGSYVGMSSAGSISNESCDHLYVIEPYITGNLRKEVSTNTPQPIGNTLTFKTIFGTPGGLQNFVESFTMVDTLPEGLTYVPGSLSSDGTTPTVTYTPNINGTNRDLLEYTVMVVGGGNDRSVTFDVVIDSDHQSGTFENTVFLTDFVPVPGQPTVIKVWGPNGGLVILNTDGFTTPLAGSMPNTLGVSSGYNAADVVYNITAIPSGTSIKYVDADFTPGQSGSGGVELGSPGSVATFTLSFTNSGNDTLQNLRFIDLLPRIGDTSPLTCTPRNTEWEPDFAGNITASFINNGVTTSVSPSIEYSTDTDPCVAYWVPDGEPCGACNTGTFSTSPPATLGDVLALGFDFGSLKIPPGASILVSFNVDIPLSPTPEGIAWNTFAWSGIGIISGAEVGAEPSLVGVSTDEFDLALTKIVSATTSPPYTQGSPISFEIRVVNQGDFRGFDIDVLDYFNASDLNFVSFSNPNTTNGGNPVVVTVTDANGSDGQTGFEISELANGDEVTITANFTIDPAFSGAKIINESEIVAGSVFDEGATTFDIDSDLALTGGSGTEIDDEIGDPSNGGIDNLNDQDDFDFAEVTFLECSLTASCTKTDQTNCTSLNGSVTVTPSDTQGNLSYVWVDANNTTIGNTATINGLGAGTYTVTVTDDISAGCTATCNVTVLNNTSAESFTATTSATANTNCVSPNGIANVTTNASSPTYLWSSGGTSASISNLVGGFYTVTVTDGVTGCTVSENTVIDNDCPCNLSVTLSNQIYNDNSTPNDLSDDTFSFNATIAGSVSSGWIGGGQSGSYGQTVTFGPYPVDGSGVIFTIQDAVDSSCKASVGANMSSCVYLETCTCCQTD